MPFKTPVTRIFKFNFSYLLVERRNKGNKMALARLGHQ